MDDTGVRPRLEAKQYRIQVGTAPNFQSGTVIETKIVDQTTFTSFATTYPEGPIYWRVQAIDGTGNDLAWSETRSFVKKSPKPDLQTPLNGVSGPGGRTLPVGPAAVRGQLRHRGLQERRHHRVNAVIASSPPAATGPVAFSPTTPLPVSSTPYTWRVRRVDANAQGRVVDLSVPAEFRVAGRLPSSRHPPPAWCRPRRACSRGRRPPAPRRTSSNDDPRTHRP